jgi:hypothetical protein
MIRAAISHTVIISSCEPSEKEYDFSDGRGWHNTMQPIEKQILNRVYGKGRGWSFFKNDFSDLGALSSVDRALSRLQAQGTIRRVIRGLYDYPKYSALLKKEMGPDFDQVAQALARKHGWTIQVSGNAALNIIGLSTQVPTQYVYHSNGASKYYNIGNTELAFKKAALKDMGLKYSESALLVQALKALDKKELTKSEMKKIAEYFPASTHQKILKDARYTTGWVYEIIKALFKVSA